MIFVDIYETALGKRASEKVISKENILFQDFFWPERGAHRKKYFLNTLICISKLILIYA